MMQPAKGERAVAWGGVMGGFDIGRGIHTVDFSDWQRGKVQTLACQGDDFVFSSRVMAKVLVGLSGGVDSSAAAAMLLEQGHEVVGGFMKNWINAEGIPGDCPWESDLEDALAVARALKIEFRVIDLIDQYKARIVDYLIDGYRQGITPNPDVWCNREMKFGVFLDYALEQGFEYVATGHYARKRLLNGGEPAILRGADPNKDQSYFLSLMTRKQVAHALFPAGELLKPQVREVARRHGLPTAEKKDSQGICFIGEIKMSDFIRHYIPDHPGEIVDIHGKKLGTHSGLHLYTLGQRKGHGVASPREGMAYVVVEKKVDTNQLVLGWDELSTPGLFTRHWTVGSISWLIDPPQQTVRLESQPRYRAKAEPVDVTPQDDGKYDLRFVTPQRAIAAGQICAFYDGGRLLGGGVFESGWE
jgi:tRNA-uridine 2-sulfurtransferase